MRLLPTPHCGEEPACAEQPSYSNADKQIHTKPDKPFQQGCGTEQTCTRAASKHGQRSAEQPGRARGRRQALVWLHGTQRPDSHNLPTYHGDSRHDSQTAPWHFGYVLRFMSSMVRHAPCSHSQASRDFSAWATQTPQRRPQSTTSPDVGNKEGSLSGCCGPMR